MRGRVGQLIIRLMLETAAREEGIANIKTTDLIEKERRYYFVRITDKMVSRLSPISGDLYHRLVDYRPGRSDRPRTNNRFLFVINRRSRITKEFEPMGTDGIYRLVKAAAEDAALTTAAPHPHLLGFSLGGGVLLNLAMSHWERLRRIVVPGVGDQAIAGEPDYGLFASVVKRLEADDESKA